MGQVLVIKKIYQRVVNNVNLSVLKLQRRYLHQNGVEFQHKLNAIIFVGLAQHHCVYNSTHLLNLML